MNSRDRLVRKSLRTRFVVTMRGGSSFEGLLLEVDDRTLILADAYAVDAQSRTKVDGALYLPRGEVAYMQKPEDRA